MDFMPSRRLDRIDPDIGRNARVALDAIMWGAVFVGFTAVLTWSLRPHAGTQACCFTSQPSPEPGIVKGAYHGHVCDRLERFRHNARDCYWGHLLH